MTIVASGHKKIIDKYRSRPQTRRSEINRQVSNFSTWDNLYLESDTILLKFLIGRSIGYRGEDLHIGRTENINNGRGNCKHRIERPRDGFDNESYIANHDPSWDFKI